VFFPFAPVGRYAREDRGGAARRVELQRAYSHGKSTGWIFHVHCVLVHGVKSFVPWLDCLGLPSLYLFIERGRGKSYSDIGWRVELSRFETLQQKHSQRQIPACSPRRQNPQIKVLIMRPKGLTAARNKTTREWTITKCAGKECPQQRQLDQLRTPGTWNTQRRLR